MAGKIFINYRRDDAKAEAARLHDKLALHFGGTNVFMDVDNLLPGERFDLRLQEALAETDVFLAVIGARWLELLEARAARRERDFVREEIAAALARKIVVIPVPMDGAPLPSPESLPEDIRELVLYHKQGVAHESFGRDVHALVSAIEAHRQAREKKAAEVARLAREREQAEIEAAARARQEAKEAAEAERRAREQERQAQRRQEPAAVPWKAASALAVVAVAAFIIIQLWPYTPPLPVRVQIPADTVTSEPMRPAPPPDAAKVSAPKAGDSFKDCSDCPEMVVVPKGSFTMGSPPDEKERYDDEGPQHEVTIGKPFAVGKYIVTFDEWDACVSGGGCKGNPSPGDEGWGKGRRPVINVSWDDAQEYVKWLSQKTRKNYRLLSEAEWEYAARAGTRTRYFWGDSLGRNNANCDGCGSQWDGKKTAEVGQFQPNAFGLYDMAGNVWQRTDDCWNGNYNGAPKDGSAMTTGDCSQRVLRGGSWALNPRNLRAAARVGGNNLDWLRFRGFRLARTF